MKKNLEGYVVPNTDVVALSSKITNREYQLQIHFPDGFDVNKALNYPVFYVLDGQWDFTLAINIYGKLNHDKVLPKAIIVGIAWDVPEDKIEDARVHDLAGSADRFGAQLFLQALEDEIIPYIQTTYRADGPRLITGSSLGGSFITYALLEKPLLFQKYIAISPIYIYSYGISEKELGEKIDRFYSDFQKKDIHLYLACERDEKCINLIQSFLTHISNKEISGLRVNFSTFEEFGHAGASMIGNLHGFKVVGSSTELVPPALSRQISKTFNEASLVIGPTLTSLMRWSRALRKGFSKTIKRLND